MSESQAATGCIYLDENQLAERLGVAVKTIQSWRSQRIGPQVTPIGRLRKYRIEDVIAWEEERRASWVMLAAAEAR